MKTLSVLKKAVNHSSISALAALIAIAPFVYPHLVVAAEMPASGNQGLVFQINTTLQNQNSLTLQQVTQTDPLAADLKAYLVAHNSPLADYTNELLSHSNWKMVLAISYVESGMGVHHYYYNSSGIGGQEYLRKYSNYGEWIDDMSTLLDNRYSGWTVDQMNGVYVQPRSINWGYGAKKIMAELTNLEGNANAERAAIAQTAMVTNAPVVLASITQ